MWLLLLEIFRPIKDIERNWLKKRSFSGLIVARFFSLITFAIMIYLLTIMMILLLIEIDNRLSFNMFDIDKGLSSLWAFTFLIAMPFFIPFLTNFFNYSYNYSERIFNFIEVMSFCNLRLTSIRSLFEVYIFLSYILVGSFLSLIVLSKFVNETILSAFNNYSIVLILLSFHTTIYLMLRVLILPEGTPEEKFVKARRKFFLWAFACIITFCFTVYKLSTSHYWVDFLYLTLVLFLSVDRLTNSYGMLREFYNQLVSSALYHRNEM